MKYPKPIVKKVVIKKYQCPFCKSNFNEKHLAQYCIEDCVKAGMKDLPPYVRLGQHSYLYLKKITRKDLWHFSSKMNKGKSYCIYWMDYGGWGVFPKRDKKTGKLKSYSGISSVNNKVLIPITEKTYKLRTETKGQE